MSRPNNKAAGSGTTIFLTSLSVIQQSSSPKKLNAIYVCVSVRYHEESESQATNTVHCV